MSMVEAIVDTNLRTEEKNRPYEKYKNHLQGLVNFGSITLYMKDQYLKNFINEEHTNAIVYDIGFTRIKELFPDIKKEDLDDVMLGFMSVSSIGIVAGNEIRNAKDNIIENQDRVNHNLYLRNRKEIE